MFKLSLMFASKAEIKKLYSLAISVGGVQAMIAVVSILTIKIIASLGSEVLAGITAGQRLYFIMQAVLLGLNVGSLILISRSHGEKQHHKTHALIRLSLFVTLIITLLFGVLFLLFPQLLLQSLGMKGEALREGINYIQVLAISAWLIGLYLIFAGALRACGYVRIPLLSGIVLNVAILFFTYFLLIFLLATTLI